MVVTTGEPVGNGPSADSTRTPSLVIWVLLLRSAGAIAPWADSRRTRLWVMGVFWRPAAGSFATLGGTEALRPEGIAGPPRVPTPPASLPPSLADTKLVCLGSGSVMVTPVAPPLP